MTENEFMLEDRLQKIKSTIEKYGEENFYISFSGGKDSTVLSALIDLAMPENNIPRVYVNTGIEYNMIVDFVKKEQGKDHKWELVIIKPSVPIRQMLEKEGYPFKSKVHAKFVDRFQRKGMMDSVKKYVDCEYNEYTKQCPKKLQYQFSEDFKLRISHKCCDRMKKDLIHNYEKESGRQYGITGIMLAEGGIRENGKCITFLRGKLKNFQPLVPVTKEWEDWFIERYNVDICDIYKPPYNFHRTGCKGCPFAWHLQKELDTLEKFFPAERKQCEIIWKPVYDEYRRVGYRLKGEENKND